MQRQLHDDTKPKDPGKRTAVPSLKEAKDSPSNVNGVLCLGWNSVLVDEKNNFIDKGKINNIFLRAKKYNIDVHIITSDGSVDSKALIQGLAGKEVDNISLHCIDKNISTQEKANIIINIKNKYCPLKKEFFFSVDASLQTIELINSEIFSGVADPTGGHLQLILDRIAEIYSRVIEATLNAMHSDLLYCLAQLPVKSKNVSEMTKALEQPSDKRTSLEKILNIARCRSATLKPHLAFSLWPEVLGGRNTLLNDFYKVLSAFGCNKVDLTNNAIFLDDTILALATEVKKFRLRLESITEKTKTKTKTILKTPS